MSEMPQTRCGYVGLLGRPNVGKSTLMNHVLKQKISITSRRPQTTRTNVLGIDTQDNNQAIYVDTPGIHRRTDRVLNAYMVNNATTASRDVDVSVMVVEGTRWTSEDEHVVRLLQKNKGDNTRCLAVINKADLVKDKDTLLPVIQQLAEYELFDEIVPLSALRNEGIERFREVVFRHLPEGPHMFSADDITDQTERQLVEEIVREKLMRQLGDEIPHSAVVRIEKFTNGDPVTEIFADIYVERSSQKSIVIGKQGKRLKLIGSEARKDAEELLQRPIMLHLWVKVRKGWTNDPKLMQRLGYE